MGLPSGNVKVFEGGESTAGLRVAWSGANRWKLPTSGLAFESPPSVKIIHDAGRVGLQLYMTTVEARSLAAALVAAADAADAAPFYDDTTASTPEVR